MTAQNNNFIHLHVHSEYSLLDGTCRLENLVQQAKALGQSAIAVTDHGNLYAGLKFYQIAKQAGIKPIIGCEMYVARRTRFDRDAKFDRKSHHLVLLCENQTGYQNLIKLVSL
ncbi:MAG: PHP domain-containing protein, partial [Oscillospiraceae bacterium]|nr:PHP domain-containing protein [Oscillospiraceae bacterium]